MFEIFDDEDMEPTVGLLKGPIFSRAGVSQEHCPAEYSKENRNEALHWAAGEAALRLSE